MSKNTEFPFDLRSEFPIKEQYVFLNHAGVAPIPVSTQMAITEFARDAAEEGPANYAAWLHGMAQAREAAARLINAEPRDICFTHNTTHGILIIANSINWRPGDNIVGFAHEFPANVHPWRNLAERGVELRLVAEQPDYRFRLDDVIAAIDERTRLLAVSWVEYGTGVRNDIAALAQICTERGVMFFLDAIQGLGVLPLDVQEIPVDFLSADGHKWLLAPEGCGILYVRRSRIPELNLNMCGWCGLANPQDYDNYDQPYKPDARRFEEGSHNLMTIHALGSSLRLLLDVGLERIGARVQELTEYVIEGVRRKGYSIITPTDVASRAGIVSFIKEGISPSEIVQQLQERKILIAARRGFLRVSPHFYNDESELDQLLDALP
ncbi:MAG: aminotransferase class V-fold PLP-dependent enzyme [Candidatus Sumerlaea chitinivorans]|uniref:Cysteine desulfurase n=1 Tax=Sumerlaea chitinivorans TaxID=2250252 RepID=A0A2Z4Y4F2_SUMC1|nr:Cysteine desulfurase [Candidatus Sumerlaea chitinivorans]MCX7963984.1 aminotransferase class V-fold PLP-dependent enzyme [Candidatus Sumerlaea chitinivorans]